MEVAGQIHSYQTGKIVIASNTGNHVLMIVYDYDRNSIHTEPLKSRASAKIVRSFIRIHDYLPSRGCKPKLQRLYNEASRALKQFIWEEEIDLHQTPAGSHQRNIAEREIRMYQNHPIACFCGTNPDFPIASWDLLLPQVFITLNLLRNF